MLIVASTSGTAALPVELCLRAAERGLTSVALTVDRVLDAARAAPSVRKRLADVGDIVIDSAAPYGDGLLRMDGVEHPCCPFSGHRRGDRACGRW